MHQTFRFIAKLWNIEQQLQWNIWLHHSQTILHDYNNTFHKMHFWNRYICIWPGLQFIYTTIFDPIKLYVCIRKCSVSVSENKCTLKKNNFCMRSFKWPRNINCFTKWYTLCILECCGEYTFLLLLLWRITRTKSYVRSLRYT